jgi:polyisoprenyl-teichoic acid--peptidoglycan teichoic acid transferase
MKGKNMRSEKTKKRNWKKRLAITLVVLLAFVGAGALAVNYAYGKIIEKFEKVEYVDLSKQNLDIDPKVDAALKDYQNILLVGVDARRGEKDSNSRADAIIIISINKKTGDFRLISVYRDTLLDLQETGGNHRLDKVTHSFVYGGALNTMRTLNRNLDLNIKDYIKVNWYSVADFVDAMGGLTLNIKDYEVSEINKYIGDTNASLKGDSTMLKKPGIQVLNGVQAVTYCRIRHVGNGDYERTQRMRNTIKAAFAKAKTMKLKALSNVMDKTLPEISTSINPKSMIWMLYDATKYKMMKSAGWPYETTGAMVNGVWYGPPVNLAKNVTQLHKNIFGQSGYVPTDRVKKIGQAITDMTGVQ